MSGVKRSNVHERNLIQQARASARSMASFIDKLFSNAEIAEIADLGDTVRTE